MTTTTKLLADVKPGDRIKCPTDGRDERVVRCDTAMGLTLCRTNRHDHSRRPDLQVEVYDRVQR